MDQQTSPAWGQKNSWGSTQYCCPNCFCNNGELWQKENQAIVLFVHLMYNYSIEFLEDKCENGDIYMDLMTTKEASEL